MRPISPLHSEDFSSVRPHGIRKESGVAPGSHRQAVDYGDLALWKFGLRDRGTSSSASVLLAAGAVTTFVQELYDHCVVGRSSLSPSTWMSARSLKK
jgi:hypothetical protein